MKAKMQIILSITVLIIVFLGTLTITSLSYKFLLHELQKQIVKDNQAIGRQIFNILAEHKLSSLSEEEQRKLLQIICNEVQLPNGGFVCAVSPDGTMFAYPGKEPGEESTMSFSQDRLSDLEQEQVRPFSDLPDDKPFTGLLARQSQTDIIAAVPIENTELFSFLNLYYYTTTLILTGLHYLNPGRVGLVEFIVVMHYYKMLSW